MIIQLVIYSIMNIFQSTITELIGYVLCFGNEDDRTSFSKYYTRKFEIKEIRFVCSRDLSKQIELENSDLKQQINFVGKLEDDEATMFFIIEKSEETTFAFLQNSVNII